MRVHTQVDRSTIHHAGHLIRSMIKLAKEPDKLEFFLYSLKNSDLSVIDALRKEGINNKIENIAVPNPKRRSVGHGQACNAMLQGIDTNEINIVADADSVVVIPRWDELVEFLINNNVGTIGTPYEDVGGFSAGTGARQTYKGLPNVIWMMLGPGYHWNDLDMMPDKKKETPLTEQSAMINGLKVGQILFRDVGWRIPSFIYENNIPYITFEHIKPTDERAIALKGLDWDYHEEYQLQDIPFCVHHRGASKHPYRRSGRSNAFYDRVDTYIEEVKDVVHDWSKVFSDLKPNIIGGEPCVRVTRARTPKQEQKTQARSARKNFVIAAAMPRSGTRHMSRVLSSCGITCGHEMFFNLVQGGFNKKNIGDSSGWAGHYLDGLNDDIPVYHMVRNPKNVIEEWVSLDTAHKSATGSHIFNTEQAIEWLKENAGFDYISLDPWERAARAWVEWNKKIQNSNIIKRFKIEDLNVDLIENISLTSGPAINCDVAKVLKSPQKQSVIKSKGSLNKDRVSSDLWDELVQLSEEYGYKLIC